MKPTESMRVEPINRLRLFLFSVAVIPTYMALTLVFVTGTMVYIFRAQTQVVQIDSDNADGRWSRIKGPPGVVDQLETAADGSLWASTRMKDSISRLRDGQWEVFRRDSFGTSEHTPFHEFVVVGNRVWAVIEDDLVEFDGQSWKNHTIPSPADDHVLAANQETVWLLGNDGILRTFDGQNWDSTEPQSSIEALCWDSERRFFAPDFLAADEGSLWACSGQLWRWKDEDWKQVPFQEQMLTDASLRGWADDKIWLDDPRGLLWIGQDMQTEGLFTREQLGLVGHEYIHGVYQLDEQTYASGSKGVYLLDGPNCTLKWPVPDGIYRCEALAMVDGQFHAVTIGQASASILWLGVPVAAILAGLGLIGIRWFLNPGYSLFKVLNRRYVILMILAPAPLILADVMGLSVGVLLPLAPLIVSMFLLMATPMLTLMVGMREMIERSNETTRYRPVTVAEMPSPVVEWMEENSPQVEALGFRRIGDFRPKLRSENWGRCFIHSDGTVLAELTWQKASFVIKLKCFSCFSLTDDLTYLETGNLAVPRDAKKEDKENFIMQSVPSATAAETLDAHRNRLKELADSRQTRPMALVEDDLEEVAHYGQKLLFDELKSRKIVTTNPYQDMPFNLGNRNPQEVSPADFTAEGSEPGTPVPPLGTPVPPLGTLLPPLGNTDGFNSPSQTPR